MARARNIKPSFFVNDRLGELPPLARLLFIGLWGLADRKGKLEDRPKRIKIEVLPYDDCDVDHLLDLLDLEFIVRYKINGISCIQILNFSKHQKPHPKEGESDLPDMPVNYQAVNRCERAGNISGKNVPKNFQVCTSREKVMTSPVESLLLNVESPILNVDCCLPHTEAAEENDNVNAGGEVAGKETDEAKAIGTRAVDWAQKNWGRQIVKGEADKILDWCDEFSSRGSPDPDAVVIEALKFCIDANVRKMNYLRGVLTDWREKGVLTVDHLKSREAERKSQKEHKQRGIKDPVNKASPEKYNDFYL